MKQEDVVLVQRQTNHWIKIEIPEIDLCLWAVELECIAI